MESSLPNEIWRIILRTATLPPEVRAAGKREQRLAKLVDPDYIDKHGDTGYEWREAFQPPNGLDTVTSLRTKHSLVHVSHRFYDLSLEYLYETIYIRRYSPSALASLRNLLERKGPIPVSKVGAWPKYLYLAVTEYPWFISDRDWAPPLAAVVRSLTNLQGFIFRRYYEWSLPGVQSPDMFTHWETQANEFLESVPSGITHFEWTVEDILLGKLSEEGVQRLLRRSKSLRAVRLQASLVDLDLSAEPDQTILPNLQILDVSCNKHYMRWTHLPSLKRYTFVCTDSFLLKEGQGDRIGLLPALTTISFRNRSEAVVPAQLRILLLSSPNLETLTYTHDFCNADHRNLWTSWMYPEQSFLQHVTRIFYPAYLGHAAQRQVLETTLEGITEELGPLADKAYFPQLRKVTVAGMECIPTETAEQREELPNLIYEALSRLVEAGIEVVVLGREM